VVAYVRPSWPIIKTVQSFRLIAIRRSVTQRGPQWDREQLGRKRASGQRLGRTTGLSIPWRLIRKIPWRLIRKTRARFTRELTMEMTKAILTRTAGIELRWHTTFSFVFSGFQKSVGRCLALTARCARQEQ
jgi:hypothetical protein